MTARAWTVVGLLCLANFAVFVVVALILGGDALNGKTEGGRYFLASHGKQTEVSRETFVYSEYHALSVFITHPIFFLAAWKANGRRGRPRSN